MVKIKTRSDKLLKIPAKPRSPKFFSTVNFSKMCTSELCKGDSIAHAMLHMQAHACTCKQTLTTANYSVTFSGATSFFLMLNINLPNIIQGFIVFKV